MARTAEKAPNAGMHPTARHALDALSLRGPHEVLEGDLAAAGLAGLVCTPRAGKNLPAVVFGHGWLQPAARYRNLLRHLASWGVVAAAPNTQRGLLPSHAQFGNDLLTALDLCTSARLGNGGVAVSARRLGLAGHAMGAGSAVLAAASDNRVRAVATLALAETRPFTQDVAARCTMPALHIAAGQDRIAPPVGNAEPVARSWGGPVALRTIGKATHLGFTEGRRLTDLMQDGHSEYTTHRLSRALLTAFFLRALAGDHRGTVLLDNDVRGCSLDGARSLFSDAALRSRKKSKQR